MGAEIRFEIRTGTLWIHTKLNVHCHKLAVKLIKSGVIQRSPDGDKIFTREDDNFIHATLECVPCGMLDIHVIQSRIDQIQKDINAICNEALRHGKINKALEE